MCTEIKKIIKEDKYNIEIQEEVDFVESKSYLKTVSSFANGTCVGYIIFGIKNNTNKVIGIKNVKKSYDEIVNKIKLKIEPSITPIIVIINIENKNIILVKIIPGNHPPYYFIDKQRKISYIRKGNQNIEENNLELNKTILKIKKY